MDLVVREMFANRLPWLMARDPTALIGGPPNDFSDIYQLATNLGIIRKRRAINDRIRQTTLRKRLPWCWYNALDLFVSRVSC